MDFLTKLFVNAFPVVLLIAIWVYFMRNSSTAIAQKQLPEYMRKHLELQERIAAALEKIAAQRHDL